MIQRSAQTTTRCSALTAQPLRTHAGRIGDAVVVRVTYCCAALGLEELHLRAADDDPRCPCARRDNAHPELAGVRS